MDVSDDDEEDYDYLKSYKKDHPMPGRPVDYLNSLGKPKMPTAEEMKELEK